jgi:hypothetical protein
MPVIGHRFHDSGDDRRSVIVTDADGVNARAGDAGIRLSSY